VSDLLSGIDIHGFDLVVTVCPCVVEEGNNYGVDIVEIENR
jgi:hypothetical protein